MPPDPLSNGSLYGKILNRDGTVALIAFILIGFLMWVVYMGQEELKTGQKEQTQYLRSIDKGIAELNAKQGTRDFGFTTTRSIP